MSRLAFRRSRRGATSYEPADEREPAILERPVLGWTAAGVTADGTLDVEGTSDWIGEICSAVPCADAGPVDALTDAWGAVGEHTAPAPFCRCGLAVYPGGPKGRWRDRYRDRLGYRMQAAALVATWGRVIIERDRVRGEYGRVLALLVASGEPASRRDRMDHAARCLGAPVVAIDDDAAPDFRALAGELGRGHGEPLDRVSAAALLRRRDVRRWRTISRMHVNHALISFYVIALVAGVVGMSLDAFGVRDGAIAAIVGLPAVVLLALDYRRALAGFTQVEALAPTPGGRHIGQAITPAASADLLRSRQHR